MAKQSFEEITKSLKEAAKKSKLEEEEDVEGIVHRARKRK